MRVWKLADLLEWTHIVASDRFIFVLLKLLMHHQFRPLHCKLGSHCAGLVEDRVREGRLNSLSDLRQEKCGSADGLGGKKCKAYKAQAMASKRPSFKVAARC